MSGTVTTLPEAPAPEVPTNKVRDAAFLVHICYAASFVVGFSSIVGVIIAYMKRADAVDTIYASHFTYAIRTFWIGAAMALVAFVLCFVLVGFLLLPLLGIWLVVRVVRPFLAWNDHKPIVKPTRFF
jgi:uncharacterized membrane protein